MIGLFQVVVHWPHCLMYCIMSLPGGQVFAGGCGNKDQDMVSRPKRSEVGRAACMETGTVFA